MKNYSIFSVVLIFLLISCMTGCRHRVGSKPDDTSSPNSSKDNDNNFISAPNLTKSEIDRLWGVATDKCFDFGWTVPNSDRTTNNLMCQTMSEGTSSTIRVKFMEKNGILVEYQMQQALASLFGKSLTCREHKDMKAALRAVLNSIMPSAVAAPVSDQFPVNDLRTAQKRLAELGYNPGPSDGAMGKKTSNAIRKFQSDHGLNSTGELTSETLKELNTVK